MTPQARLQAAIGVLDQYLGGAPLEKALTNWARKSRYAGSKDRAAVRDIVFQCVRCRSSYSVIGGESGRGLGIGYASQVEDADLDLFDGSQYGPDVLSKTEQERIENKSLCGEDHVNLNVPEWLYPSLEKALGVDLKTTLAALQTRAPAYVRVNRAKASRDEVVKMLASDGIKAVPNEQTETALEIVENPRRLNNSKALQQGFVELQDVSSQAVCLTVPMDESSRVLDFCAGGGGKSLALADRPHKDIFAHDINQARMNDIPERAKRAGSRITLLNTNQISDHAPFDVVLCDVPCSGSGAWRRSPEGKWSLTENRLTELCEIQAQILRDTAEIVAKDGTLVYATCSMLCEENEDQIERFLESNVDWQALFQKRYSLCNGGDGFFVAHLTRKP